ncbi:MAG: type II toxin-antitoxin system HicB family antitoxin [Planctomycetota bacterium]
MELNVVIEQQRDGTYIATSPSLPDCVTRGGSPKEVLERHRIRLPRYVATSSDSFPDSIQLHVLGSP